MPEKVIDIPGVGAVAFPDSMSDDAISAAAAKLYQDAQRPAPAPAEPTVPAGPAPTHPLGRLGDAVLDVGMGAAKGAASTAAGLGRLVHQLPGVSRAVDAVYGQPGLSAAAFNAADAALQPTSSAQTIGKAAEQIGEVLVPSRAITAAGTALAGRVAPALGQVVGQTAARVLPRAAVEAVGGAGLAAAQGGSAALGGVLGAAVPVAGAAIQRAPVALREQAEKQVQQALGATKERFKAMAERLTPQILQRGLRGSRDSLQRQAADMAETAGEQIDVALAQYGAREVNAQPVVDALETAKDSFRTTTRMPIGEALAKGKEKAIRNVTDGIADVVVEIEPRSIRQLSQLQALVQSLGDAPSVDQLVAVRRAWDTVVDQAGGFAHRAGGAIGVPLKDTSEAWAKREGASAIRKLLDAEVPELSAVNKEFAFWKSLDDVLTQTQKRTAPQGPGLLRQGAEMAGQAVGGVAGAGAAGPAGAVGG
ncbi:MAG TPA: hypothetical protein VEL28_17460, partial [Candidatus Binatia bacterium]|nr:hypothetical protein [Candidatus Binatia bacterium]